jgi:hypothetical protein
MSGRQSFATTWGLGRSAWAFTVWITHAEKLIKRNGQIIIAAKGITAIAQALSRGSESFIIILQCGL